MHQSKNLGDLQNPRNFLKLNKKAAIDKMVTAKDVFQYRKTHDARIPFGVSALKQNRGLSLPNEAFSYGRANRP